MANEIENTEGEVLHLNVGSGGIDIGNHFWQLYCLEHDLDVDGCMLGEQSPPRCFFSEGNDHQKKKFRPRTLFIDHDSTAIDEVKASRMKSLYTDDQFVIFRESSDSISNEIRKQVEVFDHFQGFILSHSTSGRCSSLCSELLMDLKSEHSKTIILTNSVFGSSVNISWYVEPIEICWCYHTYGKQSYLSFMWKSIRYTNTDIFQSEQIDRNVLE